MAAAVVDFTRRLVTAPLRSRLGRRRGKSEGVCPKLFFRGKRAGGRSAFRRDGLSVYSPPEKLCRAGEQRWFVLARVQPQHSLKNRVEPQGHSKSQGRFQLRERAGSASVLPRVAVFVATDCREREIRGYFRFGFDLHQLNFRDDGLWPCGRGVRHWSLSRSAPERRPESLKPWDAGAADGGLVGQARVAQHGIGGGQVLLVLLVIFRHGIERSICRGLRQPWRGSGEAMRQRTYSPAVSSSRWGRRGSESVPEAVAGKSSLGPSGRFGVQWKKNQTKSLGLIRRS